MIQSTVNAKEARDNFSEILGRVKFAQEIVTIEKKGKPYAIMISPTQYEAFQRAARKRFGDIIAKIHARNAHIPQEEVEEDIEREVKAVRKQLYEASKQ